MSDRPTKQTTKLAPETWWLPMTLAPKDGRFVLLWDGWYRLACWDGRSWSDGSGDNDYPDAALWCPIPPDPEVEGLL